MEQSILDLFQPDQLVSVLRYQADTPSDCWEQRHIDAMVRVCEYLQDVYPLTYDRVAHIHRKFQHREASD